MKKLFFMMVLFLPLIGHSRVVVVSDIDDTIRVSEVRYLGRLAYNHFWGAPAFTRLVDIYWDIKNYYESEKERVEFYYLTASSVIFDVKSWLIEHNLPNGFVQQKPLSYLFTSTKTYKLDMLTKKLRDLKGETEGNLTIYMFGDTGQYDPYVYHEVQNKNEFKDLFTFHSFSRVVYNEVPTLDEFLFFKTEADLLSHPFLSPVISQETRTKILEDKENNKLVIIK